MGRDRKQRQERMLRESSQRRSRRMFLKKALAMAGLLSLAGVGSPFLYNLHVARERQKFIDNILNGAEIPFCSGVIYDHTGSKIRNFFKEATIGTDEEYFIGGVAEQFKGGNYDMKTPDILNTSGKGEFAPIFVGR